MEHDEYLYFLRRAFEGIIGVLEELGDELGNTPPPMAGTNSVYAIGYHCVAVADYWIGHLIAGRPVERDRDAEFTATGTARQLRDAVEDLLPRLREDLTATGPPRHRAPAAYQGPDRDLSAAGIRLHVLEELAQHHGQAQISRDLLLTTRDGAP